MNKYSIADLEKALKYAKSVSAVTVTIVHVGINDQLSIKVDESYAGKSSTITIYSAEAAKFPTISKSETLF